jgi:NAD-dependent DNA ligase
LKNNKVLLTARALKVTRQHVLGLDNKLVFTVNTDNACHTCFVRKICVNSGTAFKCCRIQNRNNKCEGADVKLLCGRIFIVSGLFHEVNAHSATTEEEIKKMLASFGCEVKRSFLKNTPYVCVGKSANTSKIKSANKCQVEVFNLWWLQKLLFGQLTIETMQQID